MTTHAKGVVSALLCCGVLLSACGSSADEAAPAAASAVGYGSAPCVAADGSASQQRSFAAAPQQCIDTAKRYVATMKTNKGTMVFDLLDDAAPLTVNNFVNLIRAKYYDGIYFHRTVPNFVLQAGDPAATSTTDLANRGSGGPGYTFNDELPEPGKYTVGSLAMANAGPDTNGSQFFVISGEAGTTLEPKYSLFGQLTADPANLVTLNAIASLAVTDGPPSEPVMIETMTVTEQ